LSGLVEVRVENRYFSAIAHGDTGELKRLLGAQPGLRAVAGETALEIAEAGSKRQEKNAGAAGEKESRKDFAKVLAVLRRHSS